jgi:hypothetical protein
MMKRERRSGSECGIPQRSHVEFDGIYSLWILISQFKKQPIASVSREAASFTISNEEGSAYRTFAVG